MFGRTIEPTANDIIGGAAAITAADREADARRIERALIATGSRATVSAPRLIYGNDPAPQGHRALCNCWRCWNT